MPGKNGLKSPLYERMGSISGHMVPENGRSHERSGSIRLQRYLATNGPERVGPNRSALPFQISNDNGARLLFHEAAHSFMRERAHFCRAGRVKRSYHPKYTVLTSQKTQRTEINPNFGLLRQVAAKRTPTRTYTRPKKD